MMRVSIRLRDAVSADDRFLGEAAGHLLHAGGKRLRPTLCLCAAYAIHGAAGSVSDESVTGAASV